MKVNYSKLTTKGLGELSQRVIDTSKNSEIEEVKNHLFLTKLQEDFIPYYAILSKQTFSGKGKSVAQADAERDKAYMDIKVFLEAYERISTLPHHTDATELLKEFSTYGKDMLKLSYAEQSIQLTKIIEALSTQEHTERLKRLGLEPSFKTLKTAHQGFKTIFDEQVKANAALREKSTASTLRKNLEKSLKRFLDLVSLMYQTGQWTPLYLQLNELVKATK